MADAVPTGTSVAEVADLDFSGDARAAANDLSLADGRFAPDVLEVAARRAVQAWAEAVDGPDDRLRALAPTRGDRTHCCTPGSRAAPARRARAGRSAGLGSPGWTPRPCRRR